MGLTVSQRRRDTRGAPRSLLSGVLSPPFKQSNQCKDCLVSTLSTARGPLTSVHTRWLPHEPCLTGKSKLSSRWGLRLGIDKAGLTRSGAGLIWLLAELDIPGQHAISLCRCPGEGQVNETAQDINLCPGGPNRNAQ